MQHDQQLEDALRTWAEQLEEAANADIGLVIATSPFGKLVALHGMVQLTTALYHDPRGTTDGMWNMI